MASLINKLREIYAEPIALETPPDPIIAETPYEGQNEQRKDSYLFAVYAGVITTDSLNVDYHNLVGSYLVDGAMQGFGVYEIETEYERRFKQMAANAFRFTAAKQYQQVRTLQDFVRVTPGITWQQFMAVADGIFREYNINWLRTEYDTAVGQAQSIRDWTEFEITANEYPMLTYHTQRDERVRHSHAMLDGMTAPVTDPIWLTHYPKNGYNCRCFVTKAPATVSERRPSNLPAPDKGFDFNPGKTRQLFKEGSHPYWNTRRGDGHLKKKNFNLPIPNAYTD